MGSNPFLCSGSPATKRLSYGTAVASELIRSICAGTFTATTFYEVLLTLCSEIIAVSSEIHTKNVNTLCGQNVCFSVEPGGTYCNRWIKGIRM
jgi:hypothetical protein